LEDIVLHIAFAPRRFRNIRVISTPAVSKPSNRFGVSDILNSRSVLRVLCSTIYAPLPKWRSLVLECGTVLISILHPR